MEYNQLGPLLSSQGDRKGDVPDPRTGYSPYPGNANNLVIELEAYAKTLSGEDQGVVVEFVNPKYKDEKLRTEFKKPTRLECMMQVRIDYADITTSTACVVLKTDIMYFPAIVAGYSEVIPEGDGKRG